MSVKTIAVKLFIFLIILMAGGVSAAAEDRSIYLVRHAEKVADGTRDPALTQCGQGRALWLQEFFAGKTLDHIFSSDFIRTRETARPTAIAAGVDIQIYDPRDLQAVALKLQDLKGNILVVGHSNTTPQLAGLLAKLPDGENLTSLDESIYSRLYRVTYSASGKADLQITEQTFHCMQPEGLGDNN